MVISDNPKFIFVHIPKTAGSSVMQALAPEGRRNHTACAKSKHETFESFLGRHDKRRFAEYKSFAIVRHPLDRFVSHFRYLKTRPHQFPELNAVQTLAAYADAVRRDDQRVIRKPERVMAQHYWTHSRGRCLVDRIFRYEALPGVFGDICRYVGLEPRPLPQANVSSFPCEEPDQYIKKFVADYYQDDFELFGYTI